MALSRRFDPYFGPKCKEIGFKISIFKQLLALKDEIRRKRAKLYVNIMFG